MHKESNQRNAPSVTRRPRSGRFATVGRGLAAGLLPCRQMRAIPGAPRVRCTRPCPSDLRRSTEGPNGEEPGQTSLRSSLKASAAGAALFFCSSRVPSRSRRAGAGKARRVARRMRASLPSAQGRAVGKPRGLLAQSRGQGCPRDRDLEGALSWVTFFGQAKKVTRPPGRRAKPNRDERRVSARASKKNGFPLSRE